MKLVHNDHRFKVSELDHQGIHQVLQINLIHKKTNPSSKPLNRERSYDSYSSEPSAAKSDSPSKPLSLSASTSHSLSFEIPSPTANGVRSESRSLTHGSTRTSLSGSNYPARSDRSATSGSVAPLGSQRDIRISQRLSYAKLPHPSRKSEGSIDSYSESGEGGQKATINTASSKSSSSKPVPKSCSSSLYSSNSMSASSAPVVVNPGVAIGQTSRSNSYSLSESDSKLSRSISHSSTGSNLPPPSIVIRENKQSYSYPSSSSSSTNNEKSSINASSSSVGRKQSIGSESSSTPSLKQTPGNRKQSSNIASSLVRSSSGPKDASDNMNLSVEDLPITPKSSSGSTDPKDELMASLYGSFADDVLKPVKLGAKDAPHKAFNNQFNRLFPFLDTEETIKDNLNATTSLGWR